MDGRTLRTRWTALLLAGALAGLVPGGAVAAGGTAAPAGITVSCLSRVDLIPAKANGMVYGAGNGRCTITGDPGAPWYIQSTVKLQSKSGGSWKTRGVAVSWAEGSSATKRIWGLRAAVPCTGSSKRPWRIVMITRALMNEKSVTTLKTDTAVSNVKQLTC